jgi:hypothetical protein
LSQFSRTCKAGTDEENNKDEAMLCEIDGPDEDEGDISEE